MFQYRERFYQDYFSSQAGRGHDERAKEKLETEVRQLNREMAPLVSVPKDARILDIGCGIGGFVETLKRKGYTRAEGIDISPQMVAIANQLGIDSVKEADLLPFLRSNPGTFDVISGLDIIEHFSKDELVELLSLVQGALKPDGIAIFRTPNLDAPLATVFANGDFTHENYMNSSSARQVMITCGFGDIQVLASNMQVEGAAKELLRKFVWFWVKIQLKAQLFSTGRSTRNVLLSPNMLIVGRKK